MAGRICEDEQRLFRITGPIEQDCCAEGFRSLTLPVQCTGTGQRTLVGCSIVVLCAFS